MTRFAFALNQGIEHRHGNRAEAEYNVIIELPPASFATRQIAGRAPGRVVPPC